MPCNLGMLTWLPWKILDLAHGTPVTAGNRRQARSQSSPASRRPAADSGALTLLQCFGSTADLNMHLPGRALGGALASKELPPRRSTVALWLGLARPEVLSDLLFEREPQMAAGAWLSPSLEPRLVRARIDDGISAAGRGNGIAFTPHCSA